jgi:hypothetical protein
MNVEIDMTSYMTQNAMNSHESKPLLRATVEIGMGGMHTVWTRYGKGMRPSPNSFAIKYGGMPYRVEGGWGIKKVNSTPHQPSIFQRAHFSSSAIFTEFCSLRSAHNRFGNLLRSQRVDIK